MSDRPLASQRCAASNPNPEYEIPGGTVVIAALTTAQVIATEAESTSGSSALAFLFPFLILGGLFYLFILMPQRRRQKQTKLMQAAMGIGDEVRTIGGIVGTIVDEDDETFTLDLGGSTMRVVKRAVAEMMRPPQPDGDNES
ncbi:MAG: preprotein translocase subunit YajC [Acidimicrobiia bacterium]|nr:preprotein translocase subunit YajC [Acidimicrobiia bacterium]